MFRWLPIFVAIALGLLLASCATLSEEQCQAGDWRAVGVADGVEGRPMSYLSSHMDACSEYGISIDQALYEDGRAEGLRAYCRLDVAASEGLDGERYYGVCEGDLGVAFARVHGAAEDIYDLEAELNSIESDIDGLETRILRGGLTPEQIAELERDIRSLERDYNSVRRQIRLAEGRLSAIQADEQLRLSLGGA